MFQAGLKTSSVNAAGRVAVFLFSIVWLIWFSHRLAGIRIYQVDECQNVYSAQVLTSGAAESAYSNITLFQFPLAWVAHGASQSTDYFVSGRFLMVEIFWLNVFLIAVATGEKLFSGRGLLALFGAATLAPLWDYGFEIRHDNLVLTGLLLTWCLVRASAVSVQTCALVGAIAVGLQFVAFKSFVYTLPISLAFLAFSPGRINLPRWKLAIAWATGAFGIFAVIRIVYGLTGFWEIYINDFQRVFSDATGGTRFAPWQTLSRLLMQTPLLLALVAAGFLSILLDVWRHGRSAVRWDGAMPEALMVLVSLGGLIVNPTPFPYNLVVLVPFAFLFAYRYAAGLTGGEFTKGSALIPLAASVLAFAHVVPFAIATRRHLEFTNYRQEARMQLAEKLTDVHKDTVFDGIGMVPTRRSIHYRWLLHSLNVQSFISGPGPRFRDIVAACPPAVFIFSYRTDWLPEKDHAFIHERYVCVTDDLWVLGKVLPPGGGTFEVIHPGRYRISTLKASDLCGTYPEGLAGMMEPCLDEELSGSRNGSPLKKGPIELQIGRHEIITDPDCQIAVVWVGPKLDRIGRLGPSDHRDLFVNWY